MKPEDIARRSHRLSLRPVAVPTRCGKRGFLSERRARRALRFLQSPEGRGLSPYHCGRCGLWHVGSDETGARKRGPLPVRGLESGIEDLGEVA